MHYSNKNVSNINKNINRIEYIDSIKGFAILLMIFGHMKFHNYNWFIYSFHMPLFFILSGFFFNPAKSSSDRIKKLLKAYTITSIIILSIEIFFQIFGFSFDYYDFSYKNLLLCLSAKLCGCVKPVGIGNYLIPDVGPIWFLMALALGIMLYRLIYKLSIYLNSHGTIIIGILILAVLGWSISVIRGQIPFSINQALVVPLYLFVGNKIRTKLEHSDLKQSILFISVLLWGVLLYFQVQIQFMSMGQMGSLFFPIYIAGSIAASYLVILCFKTFHHINLKILKIFGTETLIILCIHCIDLFGIEPNIELYLNRFVSPAAQFITICIYKLILYTSLLIFILKKTD